MEKIKRLSDARKVARVRALVAGQSQSIYRVLMCQGGRTYWFVIPQGDKKTWRSLRNFFYRTDLEYIVTPEEAEEWLANQTGKKQTNKTGTVGSKKTTKRASKHS